MDGTIFQESLEGEAVSRKSLRGYELDLRINRNLLENRRVLNFGCGGSNLSRNLARENIPSKVVDLDLIYDPVGFEDVKVIKPKYIHGLTKWIAESYGKGDMEFKRKVTEWKRKLTGTKDRTIIQADGKALPFENSAFEIVLAENSTYQIPLPDREKVYSELLRVGNALHIHPVFGEDFNLLEKLATNNGFSIIYCEKTNLFESQLTINDPKDYKIGSVIRPEKERIAVFRPFGILIAAGIGEGSTMILKRNEN